MADSNASGSGDTITISLTHHGKPHSFTLPSSATIATLSEAIETDLLIPQANQKLMISKLGLLKHPFKDPALPVSSLGDKKITLMGSTAAEVASLTSTASDAASRAAKARTAPRTNKVQVNKTRDWKREQEESKYSFQSMRPLPYLPNPSRSLKFLQKLSDDPGIKAAMRKHQFTVGLLTEMNPVEHTQADHQGVSRTLGLNRNKGQVIELRLRTDAYDGYRDYKTIRKTLCHELAHNVHSEHDRNFWDLCHQIEREVEGADWKHGGRSVGEDDYYAGGGDEVIDDHGAWTGGEFVLGAGPGVAGSSVRSSSVNTEGLSQREILARAAEERVRRLKPSHEGESDNSGDSRSA